MAASMRVRSLALSVVLFFVFAAVWHVATQSGGNTGPAMDPEYAALPLAKARAFTAMLDLPEADSPIVPIVLGDSERTLRSARVRLR